MVESCVPCGDGGEFELSVISNVISSHRTDFLKSEVLQRVVIDF
jgi:hypothetical protein